jgi:antitoxin (DNA-binding transcriptional repressor) of toxin-antitoxin stability system
MTVTVKIAEPKGQLSELLEKIEAGEDIIIARGDVPISLRFPRGVRSLS